LGLLALTLPLRIILSILTQPSNKKRNRLEDEDLKPLWDWIGGLK
jgi:hypothetical protein